jgi:alpha-1,6-mannosyltransferase
MKIVQAANFVAPASGGIKTFLEALGGGYTAAGHERVLIVPGPEDSDVDTPTGRRITIRSPRLAATGYRLIVDRDRVRRLLSALRPDRLEVSDRSTLAGLGTWSRARGVPATVVSHERLDALLALRTRGRAPTRRAADRWNRRLAASFDHVVCSTRWAAEEFVRIEASNVVRVPLGVDLELFSPERRDTTMRARYAAPGESLLVLAGRLSAEKRPALAIEAVRALARRGVTCRLVVAGDGPLRPGLERAAAGLPVTFLGHVSDRPTLATLLASADVALVPGPVETFGLSALEALASGTPVVCVRGGAVAELLEPGTGVPTFSHPSAVAGGVRTTLAWPAGERRAAARRQAERFPWSATVRTMLDVHGAAA